MQSVEEMLELVSTGCGVGVKQNSKGNREKWIGGKLHISTVGSPPAELVVYFGIN